MADRLLASFYSNKADSTIGVQLISAILYYQAVFDDDYNYVKWQIFASAEDKGPTDNDKAGTARIVVAQNDEFRYLRTVDVYMRIWVSMDNKEFASP